MGIPVEPVRVIYEVSQRNSMFKNVLYLLIIMSYFTFFLLLKRGSIGMWFCGLQYASKNPAIVEKKARGEDQGEDEDDLNTGVEIIPPSAFMRYVRHLGCVFVYVTLQSLNIATAGLLTIIGAFKLEQQPYHEDLSGIHVIRKKNLTKFERSQGS